MNAFLVELPNRTGEMARLTDVLAKRGINILIYGLGTADRAIAGFFSAHEAPTRAALDESGIRYQEKPMVAIRMLDKPGQAASVSQMLAETEINIYAWLPVNTNPDTFIVGLAVDDPEAVRRVLGDRIVDWNYQ